MFRHPAVDTAELRSVPTKAVVVREQTWHGFRLDLRSRYQYEFLPSSARAVVRVHPPSVPVECHLPGCCSHILTHNSMQSVVAGTGSNNSGVEEIPRVKTEAKTKNKHSHSTTADTREAKTCQVPGTRYQVCDKVLIKFIFLDCAWMGSVFLSRLFVKEGKGEKYVLRAGSTHTSLH